MHSFYDCHWLDFEAAHSFMLAFLKTMSQNPQFRCSCRTCPILGHFHKLHTFQTFAKVGTSSLYRYINDENIYCNLMLFKFFTHYIDGYYSENIMDFSTENGHSNAIKKTHSCKIATMHTWKKVKKKIWKIKPINTTTWLDKRDIRAGGCFAKGYRKHTFQSVSIRFCLLPNLLVFKLKTYNYALISCFVNKIWFAFFFVTPVKHLLKYDISYYFSFLTGQHVVM